MQVAVVGERERIHSQRLDPIEQFGDPVGAVEERILTVRMEMNERHGSAAESAVFCAVMQWLILTFTFVVMTVLQRFARGGPLEARATLALGFLTLVAYVAGTIAQRLRLPRIVGYLIAGFVAGPAWLDLVHGDELQALSAISSGALALIAFAGGNELTLAALRGERRTVMLRIVAGATAIPFAAVTLVVLTVSPWFPLTAHQPFRDALAAALALGAVAAVASPTLTWALITDVRARGPLSRTTLDVTIVQDVVAVLLLIVVLALVLPLASHGAVTPGIAPHAMLIFAGSIVTGGGLALVAAQYLRVIHGRLEWLLVVLAFIVSQAVRLAGLDAVLVALAAGVTLRNVTPDQSERLRAELKQCAVPIYVVFFALAGSTLQLDALSEIWPWALLLAGLRVTGLWGGLRWAGRDPAVGADLTKYGWLGLVSQGGLAITLAAVLRRAFPEWNVSLEALLVAMIGVHQLAGPICFQWALRRAGEITEVGGVHVRETPGPVEGTAVATSGSGV
jgi:Kef-type K+ transport system membrane component KefB